MPAVFASNVCIGATGAQSRYSPVNFCSGSACRAASRASVAVLAISSASSDDVEAPPIEPLTMTRSVSPAATSDMFWCTFEFAKRLML